MTTQSSGRKPDYRVAVMDKVTNEKNSNAGGAWINQDGSISVILNGFVCFQSTKNLLITLFPNTQKAS